MSILVIVDLVAICLESGLVLFLLENESIIGKKSKQWILWFVSVAFLFIMANSSVPIQIKWFVQIILIAVIGHFIYECLFFKLLLYGFLYIIALIFSEGIVTSFWNFYFSLPIYSDNIIIEDFIPTLVLTAKAFHFFVIIIFKKITSKDRSNKTLKEIVPMLCIGVPFLFVLEYLSLNIPLNNNTYNKLFYLVCVMILLFSFIYILIYFEKHLKMQKKAQEEKAVLDEVQLKCRYYLRRKEEEQKVREIYHDLKNHFLLMDSNEITRGMKEKLKSYENYIDTGNEFFDVIISEKAKTAQQKQIKLECNIDFSEGGFVEPLDISTIFGNLLDNAIEASEKMKKGERYVFINVKKKESLMLIVVKNSMLPNYVQNIKTIKSNPSFHGYGLMNVKKAIKKYDGECDIKTNNIEFMISLILPIPEKIHKGD